ncbi:unnamed protein product [Phaeothamnion confervicola]
MNPLLARLNELRTVRHFPNILRAVEESPPRPLQVFETGPMTRAEWARDKEAYKYQYVCLMDHEGNGTWYVRRAPRLWLKKPPFHTRIIRPNVPGMLHFLLNSGRVEVRLEDREVPTPDGGRRKIKVHRLVEAGKRK